MFQTSRITLREIAEKTGVTRMAVSLALRGKAGVSKATRKHVLKAAKKLGFKPDPELAKLLSHIRTRDASAVKSSLALLTSGATPEAWKQYVTERKYVEGVFSRAKEYGYRVEEFWIDQPGMSDARLSNIIWHRGIEGILIAPLQERLAKGPRRGIDLNFNLFTAVEISETIQRPNLDRSLHDQYSAMIKVLDELSCLNYKTVGFVIEEALELRVNFKWSAAFLLHRHRMGSARVPPPLIMAAPSQPAFDKWFDHYRPDVIVSVDGVGLRFLKKRGMAIPGEVGYASLDIDGDAGESIPISGIDQNSLRVGAAAVDLLVGAIHRHHRGLPAHPVRIEIEGIWTAGKSTVRQRCQRPNHRLNSKCFPSGSR